MANANARIELIHVEIPMTEPFRISSGWVETKEAILVRIERGGRVGWGEASPMAGGFYSVETPESSWRFLIQTALPFWRSKQLVGPHCLEEEIAQSSSERFAWAGLEGALWDLEIQERGTSFLEVFGGASVPIASGLAVGIHDTIPQLLTCIERSLEEGGYARVKVKIQPGWDVEPLREVTKAFPGVPLMVDANAAYRREHIDHLRNLDDFGLLMLEQPLPANDLVGHVMLRERVSTPVCLDEGAKDATTVRLALDLEACDIVNLKIQRLGGLAGTRRVYDLCAARGVPTWMGTMPELGIGSLHALYFATLPNHGFPTDVESSERWFEGEIVFPPIKAENGFIRLPAEHLVRPLVDEEAVARYTVRRQELLLEAI